VNLIGWGKITVTGKNVGSFDSRFLERLKGWNSGLFHHRILDPGSLYFQPLVDDALPSLDECAKRAGLGKPVTHNALEDAQLVVEIVRSYYAQDRLRLAYAHSEQAVEKTETNLRLEKM
jgi:DNA polymerase III epsilon subunit-like protein